MSASYFMLKMLKKKRRKLESQIKTENGTPSTLHQCRICLKDGFIPIYDDQSSTDFSEAIQTFGEVEIDVNDEYPKYMCEQCQSLLNAAILFRKSAKESDKILRSVSITYNSNENSYSDQDETSNHSFDDKNENQHNLYSCKACSLQFGSVQELNTHKSAEHHRNIRVQCHVCQRLVTPQLYKRHLVRHQASHLICEVCGKLYRKDNLIRHLQLHNYELPFQCQECPYRGRFLESLKIHMRTHSGDKPFSCDKCELRFITRSNLNRHLLTHKKDKPHKCVECGRGFYTIRDMEVHLKADHAGIKDFSCRICGNKYGTKKAIMRHELRVHKRDKMAKGRMPLYLQEEYKKCN